MCTKYWLSLLWYLSASSWAWFCRVDTWAKRHCSLLFHLSLAIRASCSKVMLLSSKASATVRSASTQQCSPLLTSRPDSRRPHPLWQTPSPRCGFVCDSIPPGVKTWLSGSFSTPALGQSAHIVCLGNFCTRNNELGRSYFNLQVWTHEGVRALKSLSDLGCSRWADGLRHFFQHMTNVNSKLQPPDFLLFLDRVDISVTFSLHSRYNEFNTSYVWCAIVI